MVSEFFKNSNTTDKKIQLWFTIDRICTCLNHPTERTCPSVYERLFKEKDSLIKAIKAEEKNFKPSLVYRD